MKRILLILTILVPVTLFGQIPLRKGYIATQNGDSVTCIYQDGKWVLESDTTFVINVDTIKYSDGTVQYTSSSGGVVDADNGLNNNNGVIELGTNSLTKDTEIPGNSYDLSLGTIGSKLNKIEINTSADIDLNAGTGSSIDFEADGIQWELKNNYLTVQRFGRIDTLYSGYEVRELISQSNSNTIQPWNFEYEFIPTILDERPGAGSFSFNSGIASSVTRINIDDIDFNSNNKTPLIQTIDTGSYIFIFNKTAQTWPNEEFAIYKLTNGYTDATGYTKYNVTFIYDGGLDLADGDIFEITIDNSNNTGSGGNVGANNGAYKDGSNIQLGTNPLIKNTDLPGASYNFNFGTSASRLNALNFWAANIGLESSGNINIETNGIEWLWSGAYLTRQAFGRVDTAATLYKVRELQANQVSNTIQSSTFQYEFVGTTTDTRPGVSTFAFNSGIASSVTRINIDDFDINSNDKSNLLQPVDTGSYLFIFNKTAQTWPNEEFLRYKITGGYVDQAGYTTYKVSFIYDGGVDLAEGDVFVLQLDQSNSTGSGGFTSPIDTLTINERLTVNGRAEIDTMQFSSGSKITDIPQNDIFLWDSTNSKYTPYPSLQADSWYYGFNSPTGETRINWSGVLRASGIQALNYDAYSGSALGAYVQGRNAQVAFFSYTGDAGENINNDLLTINRLSSGAYDLTGDVININDSPSVTGIVSGAILSATIDGTERISLNPRLVSGSGGSAYVFDTDEDITTGDNIMSFKRQGNEVAYITNSGSFIGFNTFQIGLTVGNTNTMLNKSISTIIDFTPRMTLNPDVFSGGVAYTLDSHNDITTGSLLEVKNQGETVFTVKKDSTITSALLVDSIGFKDGSGWISGIDNSDSLTGLAFIETESFKLGSVTTDSIMDLKDAVEAESFDKLTWDTSLVNNDTITPYEFTQAIRKILYPNDYTSYLPNDSIYTTPSITLNIPTKVLIPTAIKYSRNWNLYDKGGGDFALRFEGADSSRFHITMTTSMRTSASNVVFEVFMYKNGVLEPGIAVERKIGTGADVGAISVTGAFDVTQNDYIEVFVLVDVTTTITFSKTSIVIKEDGLITN